MDKSNINLFELTYDINAMKKRDLVDQIEKMKGKVIVGCHVKDLCHQIEKLTEMLHDSKVNQVFCIGAVVTDTVTENGPPMKVFHEQDLMALQEFSN